MMRIDEKKLNQLTPFYVFMFVFYCNWVIFYCVL